MSFRLNVTFSALAVLTLVSGLAAPGSYAQTFDHLKCYKIKDQRQFKSAQVSLQALQAQFGALDNCTIKGKAKEFCVPVDKNVTQIDGGSLQTVDGTDLGFDRLCYKVKCPKRDIMPEQVSDQFGTRSIEKFKVSLLCTPAVKGPPPTTTTTTLPPLGACVGGSSWPTCSGDCSHLSASHLCEARAGQTCACVLPCAGLDPAAGDICGAGGGCPVDSVCALVGSVCGCVFAP